MKQNLKKSNAKILNVFSALSDIEEDYPITSY